MEETVTIGIAFRGHRDSAPLYRDSFPLHRDSVPPIPLKPAPTHASSEANLPLPFFTLLLLKDKPPVRLEPLGSAPRTQVHDPQRGKPLVSPMHRLCLRLAGGKGVSLALHS